MAALPKNTIVAEAEPQGKVIEGIISGTPLPGTMMQIQAGTVDVNGTWTFEALNQNAGAGATNDQRLCMILMEDDLQGGVVSQAYVSGRRGKMYCPLPGEVVNILVADVAGTGDIHTVGDRVVATLGTGKFATQGTSANTSQFTLLESTTALTADTLVLAMKS